MENPNEIWQSEVNGQIYETSFEELTQWIAEGALLPHDRVRRGNLRWIQANKVPALYGFFNARELGGISSIVATTTSGGGVANPQVQTFNNFPPPSAVFNEPPPPNVYDELNKLNELNVCMIHTDANASFHCETCTNYFCKACPTKGVCPMCGAMCKSINLPQSPRAVVFSDFEGQPAQSGLIDPDVLTAANWFYWKAGLTVINSFIMMTGTLWAFFLGLSITQIFHGVATGVTEELGVSGGNIYQGIALVLSLFCAGFVAMLGYFGRQGKRWALIVGLIIFCFDAVLYLITFSIFGVLLHGIAIYLISKGISAAKK